MSMTGEDTVTQAAQLITKGDFMGAMDIFDVHTKENSTSKKTPNAKGPNSNAAQTIRALEQASAASTAAFGKPSSK